MSGLSRGLAAAAMAVMASAMAAPFQGTQRSVQAAPRRRTLLQGGRPNVTGLSGFSAANKRAAGAHKAAVRASGKKRNQARHRAASRG